MTDSRILLRDYVRNGSETAFRELVDRYIDLVYSTALRLVEGNSQRAEDVVQTVFIDLARLAPDLSEKVLLGGWLYRHAYFTATKTMRAERRLSLREKEAASMQSTPDHSRENLEQLMPVLDEAINQLNEPEREAIVLRFFEQKSFRAVGEVLGGSEDAAQKRVARGLERLRGVLTARGVALSTAALAACLTSQAVSAAPAGLVASISSSALAGASAGGGVLLGIFKIMAISKLKLAVGAILVAGVGTTLVVQHQEGERLLRENAQLREQLAQIARQATRATQAKPSGAAMAAESGLSKEDFEELLRLRGKLGMLHKQESEINTLKAQNSAIRKAMEPRKKPQPSRGEPLPISQPHVDMQNVAFAGYADPEATVQSLFWATKQRDVSTLREALSPELTALMEASMGDKSPAEIEKQLQKRAEREAKQAEASSGYTILKKEAVSADEIWMTIQMDGLTQASVRAFKRYGDQWKAAQDRGMVPVAAASGAGKSADGGPAGDSQH